MEKIMVLCSGGLKSAFLAGLSRREGQPILVHINHRQKSYTQEAKAVKALSEYYHCKMQTVFTYPRMTKKSPLRAVIRSFSLVLDLAREEHCTRIYHGLSKDDWLSIPELKELHLTSSFLTTLQQLFGMIQPDYLINNHQTSDYSKVVDLELPLYRLQLYHVLRLGKDYSIPWYLTYSCDRGGHIHCGNCASCRWRQASFAFEGSNDSTLYLNKQQYPPQTLFRKRIKI